MTQPNIAKFSTVALAILTLPAVSSAGTVSHGKEVKSVVEKAHESCISGSLGIDMVSQYIARGIPLEDQGAILQPYINLAFRVYEGSGLLTKMTVDLAFWNSFHSRGTRASANSTTEKWFEADFVAGLSFFLGENVVLSPYYRAYMSPNDAFETAHDVGLRLAYNDDGILGGWTLSPYVLAQRDVEGTSGNGGSSGWYYEVGISPGHQFGPIALTIPIKAGFGSDGYYAGDESFGYVSAGVNLEYALAFIPECLGDWSVRGYGTYYRLGDATEGASTPDVRDADDSEWVFGGGLRVQF
jgi:hypothetical protein